MHFCAFFSLSKFLAIRIDYILIEQTVSKVTEIWYKGQLPLIYHNDNNKYKKYKNTHYTLNTKIKLPSVMMKTKHE